MTIDKTVLAFFAFLAVVLLWMLVSFSLLHRVASPIQSRKAGAQITRPGAPK